MPDAPDIATLVKEGREHDTAMLGGRWRVVGDGPIVEVESSLQHPDGIEIGVVEDVRIADAVGIAWLRNHLGQLLDALEGLQCERSQISDEGVELFNLRNEVDRLAADLAAAGAEIERLRSAHIAETAKAAMDKERREEGLFVSDFAALNTDDNTERKG